MRKLIFLSILFLLLIFLAKDFLREIGYTIFSMLNVSVKEKLDGKIFLSYSPFIEIGNKQEIYTEFVNTGTKPVTERIEVKIHGYVDGSLKPIANYFDTSYFLNPGGRKSFKCVFLPQNVGLYYIQAKSSYDTKVVEVWGAFSVIYPQAPVIYVPKPITPVAPVFPLVGFPELKLEYPESVEFYQGEKKLINITLKNVGNVSVHNLNLYISTSSLLELTIQPKQVSVLRPNESLIFIVAIQVPSTVPEGNYPFEFETMNDEGVKESGEILIRVVSIKPPEEEEINQKILNYEFMIFEIQKEINSAFFEGYNVELANKTLNMARNSLENVKNFLKVGMIKKAKEELLKVESYIEIAALQLASSTLYIYKPTAILWWLIVVIIISTILIIFFYFYLKKREKRPKVLREMEIEK